MANDINVVITLSKASPRASFGMPLIFAGVQKSAVEYKEVGNLEEVVSAGFTAESDVYKAAQLLFMQANAPSEIAVCASTETTVSALPDILDNDWRQLIVVSGEGDSKVGEISDYIESCGKKCTYFASVLSAEAIISSVEGNERTVLLEYKTNDVKTPEAAWVGATAGMDVSSYTYKNIELKGVTPQTYTDSEVKDLHELGVNTILRKAGCIVTSEGLTVSGEYIDIVDSKDWIISQIEYRSQRTMIRLPKLPYDNRGIGALEGETLAVLKEAADNGMIAANEDGDYLYTTNFAPRSQCKATDISSRHYDEGKFTFELAGAIHTGTIKGTIIA